MVHSHLNINRIDCMANMLGNGSVIFNRTGF